MVVREWELNGGIVFSILPMMWPAMSERFIPRLGLVRSCMISPCRNSNCAVAVERRQDALMPTVMTPSLELRRGSSTVFRRVGPVYSESCVD